jgi:hypothetical protein
MKKNEFPSYVVRKLGRVLLIGCNMDSSIIGAALN